MNIQEINADTSLTGCVTVSDAIYHETGHWAVARIIGAKSNYIRIEGKVTDYELGWTNGWFGFCAIADHQAAKIALAPLALGMQLSTGDIESMSKIPDSIIERSLVWIRANKDKIQKEAERLFPSVYPLLKNGDAEIKF